MRTETRGPWTLVEWTPGKWWVVEKSNRDGSYTPHYEGKGKNGTERKTDCEGWADAHQNGWVMQALGEKDDETDEPLYWSNADGWVDRASATVFTLGEHNQPAGLVGGWVWVAV